MSKPNQRHHEGLFSQTLDSFFKSHGRHYVIIIQLYTGRSDKLTLICKNHFQFNTKTAVKMTFTQTKRQQSKRTKMFQLVRSSQSLYHITNCCLMFVSSWLEKPKQIQHQSSEALNCDLFCQSCENKGCIKCPATTVGWSDSGAWESDGGRRLRIRLHGDVQMDWVFFVLVFSVWSKCHGNRGDRVFRGISPWVWSEGRHTLHCPVCWAVFSSLLQRCSSAVSQVFGSSSDAPQVSLWWFFY